MQHTSEEKTSYIQQLFFFFIFLLMAKGQRISYLCHALFGPSFVNSVLVGYSLKKSLFILHGFFFSGFGVRRDSCFSIVTLRRKPCVEGEKVSWNTYTNIKDIAKRFLLTLSFSVFNTCPVTM